MIPPQQNEMARTEDFALFGPIRAEINPRPISV